jgi:hypothetical protein
MCCTIVILCVVCVTPFHFTGPVSTDAAISSRASGSWCDGSAPANLCRGQHTTGQKCMVVLLPMHVTMLSCVYFTW